MDRNVYIMMGLPLSGKTTWISQQNFYRYEIVSADNFKEQHPDYDPLNSSVLHEWSVEKAETAVVTYASEGKNMIIDSGSINNSYTQRIIKMLKTHNYHITLVHIDTPYEVCLERNMFRERSVPAEAIIDKAVKEKAQFRKLEPLVDQVIIVPYFTNKHVFVDMDGVLASFEAIPIVNGEIDFVNGEIHKYAKPVYPIINAIRTHFQNIYILSAAPTSIALYEKEEWLDNNFADAPKEHRFYASRNIHKAEMLEDLTKKLKLNKRDILMIDDYHSTLYDVRKRGMNSMHPSELLTL